MNIVPRCVIPNIIYWVWLKENFGWLLFTKSYLFVILLFFLLLVEFDVVIIL